MQEGKGCDAMGAVNAAYLAFSNAPDVPGDEACLRGTTSGLLEPRSLSFVLRLCSHRSAELYIRGVNVPVGFDHP